MAVLYQFLKKKIDMKYRKSFKRFPGISELAKVKEFTPSKGCIFFPIHT